MISKRDRDNPEWEFKEGETTEAWTIRQVDRLTRNWSDETWKILGIANDLITLKKIRSSLSSRNSK